MLEIALILTEYDSMYEDIAFRFLEHFLWITYAMDRIGENHDEMWDTEDGFFYDLLHLPNGDAMRLKVRSMVGLLPLCASTVFEGSANLVQHPRLMGLIELFKKRHPELLKHIAPADGKFIGYAERRLLSVCNKEKLERILEYMLDENEFFGPYGIRSLSKYHLDHPFIFDLGGQQFKVQYLPAESNTGNVRRQFQLARAGVDAGERLADPSFVESLSVLRRRFQSRVPHRIGKVHDVIRSGKRDRPQTVEHLSSR